MSPTKDEQRAELAHLLRKFPIEAWEAENQRRERNRISRYYPEMGPLRRELYPKHTEFFRMSAKNRERLMMAANRVGKTEGVGAFEVTCHLTGKYPPWWEGRRFPRHVRVWAAGDTAKTVREIIQVKLLGEPGRTGTGMIPGDAILRMSKKSGVAGAIDTVWVKHVSGNHSLLVLKSYDQRRESFQGTEQDIIWLDEEPPMDIYAECLIRTMTTSGLVMLTFTPLKGLSEVVLSFLPDGDITKPKKCLVLCTWDEVPHLTKEVKEELWNTLPPHQREARSKGTPSLGVGAIYPIPETDVVVDDFEIPSHWPRAYGFDIGWNRSATIWGALNRDTDTLYLYSEHDCAEAEPAVHASAILARGKWIRGAIDPASRGRTQTDGRQLLQMYSDLGLDLTMAQNAVEAGIYRVWQRLSTGRLKAFRSCRNWLTEFRLYHRDDKGRIVKHRDHLMDATRYLEMELQNIVRTEPKPKVHDLRRDFFGGSGGWMS